MNSSVFCSHTAPRVRRRAGSFAARADAPQWVAENSRSNYQLQSKPRLSQTMLFQLLSQTMLSQTMLSQLVWS
jgi:hypothetical protein